MASNRNKLAVVFLDFFNHIAELVGQTGEDSTLAIQKVAEAEAGFGAHPIPFIVVQMISAMPVARADTDLVWECKVKVRVVSRAINTDGATTEVLTKLALVQNKIQAYDKPEGVDGFDKNEWSFNFPTSPDGPSQIQADSLYCFTVAIARGAN